MSAETKVRLRRSKTDRGRYYVVANGFEIGWVVKAHDGTWGAYANSLVDSGATLTTGVCVIHDEKFRRWAVDELVVRAFYFLRYAAPSDPKTPMEAWERREVA